MVTSSKLCGFGCGRCGSHFRGFADDDDDDDDDVEHVFCFCITS